MTAMHDFLPTLRSSINERTKDLTEYARKLRKIRNDKKTMIMKRKGNNNEMMRMMTTIHENGNDIDSSN
eukprot:CAMPEP_0184869718 /NCGR_PEP_ID=MMETSP0580-20130426/35041_1 /TAXON_ID=1118495 /ORGANISM="Dactyliosolen fragilissimus" /LENGTH=68 /DNA_ID=CAMNT_0027371377 /DNA_START=41 /DNA_END=244 /DNA_ORIENTATION=+